MNNPKRYIKISFITYLFCSFIFFTLEYAAPAYDWSFFITASFLYWLVVSGEYQRKFRKKATP